MSGEKSARDVVATLREAYCILAVCFNRLHGSGRTRDTELCDSIGRVRAIIEQTLGKDALFASGHLADVAALRAENERLREALGKIAPEPDCGCRPCRGQCQSEAAKAIYYEEFRDIARAALDVKPMSAWQPIEGAPKDGTPVLVYAAPYQDLAAFQCVASYHPEGGWCVDELRAATHWQPLPEPPQSNGE